MYNYKCSSCHKDFQSMKSSNKCIYCGSDNLSSREVVQTQPIRTSEKINQNEEKKLVNYVCSSCHHSFYADDSPGHKCTKCSSEKISPRNFSFFTRLDARTYTLGGGTSIGHSIMENSAPTISAVPSMTPLRDAVRATQTDPSKSIMLQGSSSRTTTISSSPSLSSGSTEGTTVGSPKSEDKSNGGILDTVLSGVSSVVDGVASAIGSVASAVGGIVDGIVNSVSDFFESIYTTEDDEKNFIQSFLDSSSASLQYSDYLGSLGTYEDGTGKDDEIATNLSSMEDTSGEITNDVPMDSNIFGMPLYYNAYADPCKKAFSKSIQYSLPLVYLIPGKPKVNRKLIDTTGKKIVDLDAYYEKTSGDTDSPGGGLGVLRPKNSEDMRYLSFKVNFTEYWKYVQFLTSYVRSWLYAQEASDWKFKKFDFSAELKNKYTETYGLVFYLDKSTTISETANNSYSTSRVAEMVNEKSSTTREASVIGKYNNISEFISEMSTSISSAMEGTMAGIESLKSFEGILTKSANSLMKVVNGGQLDFPEMWQDSKFDRSYSLSFRFFSPYGDRYSIEKYVYTPFLALLAFALSRQDQAFSYVEPFLVRVDAPGWIQPLHIVIYVEKLC